MIKSTLAFHYSTIAFLLAACAVRKAGGGFSLAAGETERNKRARSHADLRHASAGRRMRPNNLYIE